MALPSQGGFSSVRRGSMYRRKRGRRGISWFIVLLAASSVTWMLWPNVADNTDTLANQSPDQVNEPIETMNSTTIAMPPALPQATKEEPTREASKPAVVTPAAKPPVQVLEEVATTDPVTSDELLLSKPIVLAATTSANLEKGLSLLDNGQLVAARAQLSALLRSGSLTDSEAAQARGVLTDISDDLVFSKKITSDDHFVIEYIVRGGDTLSGIVSKMGLQVDWRFIQRINGIPSASSIRPGQNLKLVTGPFHAKVTKSTYRIDLFQGDGEEQVFVRSYRVGLGEFDSTPVGLFIVRRNSKLVNPTWINPRTREFYSADNPENPIGERWIGLEGVEERTKDLSGLGIHGTIAPNTIGTQASMGCIRMGVDDVAQVYEMLSESVSTVEIR
jgi:nucleoid-associated protein YgaU